LEHGSKPGYISEKLLLAFLGGCLPIYYGTREVFDIFHPQSFVFYDKNNPLPAMEEIRYLEANATAYQERLESPILLNGDETVEKYFSLSDDVGNGTLKRKIRHMLGLKK
jgi:hypothetical protein